MQKMSRKRAKPNIKPKKLDIKKRRRNRVIALILLGAITLFFILKCSNSNEDHKIVQRIDQKIVDSNSSAVTNNSLKEDNSTLIQPDEKDKNSSYKEANLLPTNPDIAIGKLLEEYRKKPTFSRALAVADFYYSHQKYDEAVSWSVVANNIDSHKKRSWIIYIKSKIALKEYKKAIKAIKAYLKLYDSKQLRKLLEVLETKVKGN